MQRYKKRIDESEQSAKGLEEFHSMKGINVDTLIGYVLKLWLRNKKQVLDEFGLTLPQYAVLSAAYNMSLKKEIIQTDLSDETGIDPMTISTILRNLEKNGIVTRVRGTVDTRVVYVKLTETGKELYNTTSLKMLMYYNNLYQNINERNLTTELLVLSNELNRLNN